MIGMGIALVATLWLALRDAAWGNWVAIARRHGDRREHRHLAGAPGRDDGHARAHRDAALLRRAAAVLVGVNTYLADTGGGDAVHLVEIFLGVFIGAVTFTGSIVAFLKLSARISSKPLMLPARHWLNLAALVASVGAARLVRRVALDRAAAGHARHRAGFGWHLVASIGGGDMPVVVSMLNSYSGWAAAAAGFMLGNDLLIVTGALVGSSGAYLSYIMCKAMNRSFVSVIAGGFGVRRRGVRRRRRLRRAPRDQRRGRRRPADARVVGRHHPGLRHGRRAGAVPRRRADREAARAGVDVRFGIHPVAGRLPVT